MGSLFKKRKKNIIKKPNQNILSEQSEIIISAESNNLDQSHFIQTEYNIHIPDKTKWMLTILFGRSGSSTFKLVKPSVEIMPTYKEGIGPNGEEIYQVSFKPDEILVFEE